MLCAALTLVLSAADLVVVDDPGRARPAAFGPLGRDGELRDQLWLGKPQRPLSEKPPEGWPPEIADDWKKAYSLLQQLAGRATEAEQVRVSQPIAMWLWTRYLLARGLWVREVSVNKPKDHTLVDVQIVSYNGDPRAGIVVRESCYADDWAKTAEGLLARVRRGGGEYLSVPLPTEPAPLGPFGINGNRDEARVAVKLPEGCKLPGTFDVAPSGHVAELLGQRWSLTAGSRPEDGRLWCNLVAYQQKLPRHGMVASITASLECAGNMSVAFLDEQPPNPLEVLTRQLLQPQVDALCKATRAAPAELSAVAGACQKRGRALPASLEVSPDNAAAHNLAETWADKVKGGEGAMKCELADEPLSTPTDKSQPMVRRFTATCGGHTAVAHLARVKGRTDFGPLVTTLAQLYCGEIVVTP